MTNPALFSLPAAPPPGEQPSSYRRPRQKRALATFGRLLDAAGALLGEVGLEGISSNRICARAGVTAPAFYRYFPDKHAILEALADRLMERQNRVLEEWIARQQGGGLEACAEATVDLLRATAAVSQAEPGAVWILRALRASPRLTPIRLDSHAYVSERLADLYQPFLPHVARAVLVRRTRLAVEVAYAIDEMLCESPQDSETAFADAAPMFRAMFCYPDYAAQ